MKNNIKNLKGFTLVELLVVISIIALLLSIMMPALSRARSSAKKIMCMSQMKQLSLALNMYVESWKQKFPAPDDKIGSGGTGYGGFITSASQDWRATWNEYISGTYLFEKTNKVLMKCPDRPNFWTNDPAGHYPDYGMNPYIAGWWAEKKGLTWKNIAWKTALSIKQPASKIAIIDSCWGSGLTPAYKYPQRGYYWVYDYTRAHIRHSVNRTINIVYADLHIGNLTAKYEDAVSDRNHPLGSSNFHK